MTKPNKSLSVNQILHHIILTITGLSLLLISASFLVVEFYSQKTQGVENVMVLVHVIAANTRAALEFDDQQAATRLSAPWRWNGMWSAHICSNPTSRHSAPFTQ